MGLPSSDTATMPACFIAAISAMFSPLLPTDAAPIGHTRTLPVDFARSTINLVTEALSFTGFVFGMQHTAVKPPRAAARVPVSMLSEDSWPGSRKCTCMSIKPGAIINPAASKISASCARVIFPGAPISAIFSPSRRMSCGASVFVAGSSTRPYLISSMRGFLFFWRGVRATQRLIRDRAFSTFRPAGHKQKQQRHAYGNAVGHLFEDARLRSIGHLWRNFHAAVHGARMQDEGIRIGEPQPLGIQLIKQNIFFRSEARLRSIGHLWRNFHAAVHGARMQDEGIRIGEPQPLGIQLIKQNIFFRGKRGLIHLLCLHPEHEDHVRVFKSVLDS